MLESPKTVSLPISELAGEIPAAACFFLEETKNPALSNSTNFDQICEILWVVLLLQITETVRATAGAGAGAMLAAASSGAWRCE